MYSEGGAGTLYYQQTQGFVAAWQEEEALVFTTIRVNNDMLEYTAIYSQFQFRRFFSVFFN